MRNIFTARQYNSNDKISVEIFDTRFERRQYEINSYESRQKREGNVQGVINDNIVYSV